jgi:hypothetical protein
MNVNLNPHAVCNLNIHFKVTMTIFANHSNDPFGSGHLFFTVIPSISYTIVFLAVVRLSVPTAVQVISGLSGIDPDKVLVHPKLHGPDL